MKVAAPAMFESSLVFSPARLADYVQLCRPRIAAMVLITVFLGGYLAAVDKVPTRLLLDAMVGTALVTAAASALNQWLERVSDARMARTAGRPLPSGRLMPAEVLAVGCVLAIGGLTYQWLTLPPIVMATTAFTLGSYLGVYTPAKQRTSLNTLIGAVPGAMPPVIGWTAVRGQIDAGAATLFLILFVWQVPHFLAIAWMYRDEYASAGHKMLTTEDKTGATTARQMLIYLAALVPVSLLAASVFSVGIAYTIGALALAAYWLRPVLAFRAKPDVANARAVLRASIVYLPVLLILLAVSKQLPTLWAS